VQTTFRFRVTLFYIAISAAAFILLTLLLWYSWRKRNKKIIAEKESEVAELEGKLSDAAKEVIALAKKNDDAFLVRFNELYPHFTRDIYTRHPNLTNSEYSFCVLIYLHFTSKEIAQILTVEHRSVQTRKNRLRKRLGIPSKTDLYQYLKMLDDTTG
jgi:DNA-binding CsgD family transcriptional regulator